LPSLCPPKLLLPNLCQSYSLFSHYMPIIFDFTLNPYAKHPCPTYAKCHANTYRHTTYIVDIPYSHTHTNT
jgi:hypothetical protein